MQTDIRARVRRAELTDAEAIQKIYEYYVTDTAITYEYEVPTVEEMRGRMANTLEKFPYFVAESDGKILGYCYAGPYHPRAAYQWCTELSIYLDKEARGRGIGRLLYDTLEETLLKMGYLNLYACIAHAPEEDSYLHNDSEAFHEKMGFKHISHSHKCAFKFDTWYDMVWMEKLIGPHNIPPESIKKYQ